MYINYKVTTAESLTSPIPMHVSSYPHLKHSTYIFRHSPALVASLNIDLIHILYYHINVNPHNFLGNKKLMPRLAYNAIRKIFTNFCGYFVLLRYL